MKLSKKYVRKLKKRLLGCMSSIAICLMLIAGSKLAGLSMPVISLKDFSPSKSNADETTIGDNTYGQMGNGTNESTNYLTQTGQKEIKNDEKIVTIAEGETYQLHIKMSNGFNVYDDESSVGNFTYDISNTEFAEVSNTGLVTAKKQGQVRIWISDNESMIRTSVLVEVTRYAEDKVQAEIEAGLAVILLRTDGTVWTFGENANGERGVGDNDIHSEETQVIDTNGEDKLTNVINVSASANSMAAVKEDGRVVTWGKNNYGQLGNNSKENSNKPVYVLDANGQPLTDIIKVSCGYDFVVALKKDGTVWAWGRNNYGQLGQNNINNSEFAVQVKDTTGEGYLTNIADISAQQYTVATLTEDGDVYCWGYNYDGQCGNGKGYRAAPAKLPVQTNITDVVQIASGLASTLAIKSDGTLWTWGLNRYGTLGYGSSSTKTGNKDYYKTTPVQVKIDEETFLTNVVDIGTAGEASFAKTADGTVYGWGDNRVGHLGINTTSNMSYATTLQTEYGADFTDTTVKLSRSSNTAIMYMIKEDGTILGMGGVGMCRFLDGGWYEDVKFVLEIKPDFLEIERATCLKQGATAKLTAKVAERLNAFAGHIKPENLTWTSSDERIATVSQDGTITAVGLGEVTITVKDIEQGYQAQGIVYVIQNEEKAVAKPDISYGTDFAVVLKADGTVWGTGKNDAGQLGDGTTTDRTALVQVKTNSTEYLTNIVKISAGTDHVIAVSKTGEVYTWGLNDVGQLGNGGTEGSLYAQKVLDETGEEYLSNIIDVSAGNKFSIVLSERGDVYGFGSGTYGELGMMSNDNILLPVQMARIANAVKVQANSSGSSIQIGNGTVYTTGYNYYGTLGQNETNTGSAAAAQGRNTPNHVINTTRDDILKNIVKMVTGTHQTIVLTEDNKVLVWGYNNVGQLGTGDTTNFEYPVAMKVQWSGEELTDKVIDIGASGHRTLVKTEDKNGKQHVLITGQNNNGQLGNNTTEDAISLIPVMDKNNLTEKEGLDILEDDSTAINNTGYIDYDGTVWTVGLNTYGAIGDGTNISTNYLTQMKTGSEVSLNKRNEYIKIGETLDLDVQGGVSDFNVYIQDVDEGLKSDQITYTWTSSNTDVAEVSANGVVTGIGIGHTTITAYNEELGLKAKAIINVYRNKAGAVTVPQVASGEGFTVVLKEDGTVWATGKNNAGQLGDGTTTNRNTLEQVKIDEHKYLTNIEKISIGYSHVAALTLDGQVYAWGANSDKCGNLGQGDTINRSYATKVKGAEGVGYLEDIIDIACGNQETYVLNKDGIAYGCGYNEYAQINDDNINNILYPTQVTGIKNIIKLTSGECDIGAILANGETWVKGHNFFGAFGNGVTAENGGIYLVGTDINEFELSGYFAAIIKEDGTLWTTGRNDAGQLGLGDTTDRSTYTQVKYKNGKIVKTKYIALGYTNLQFIGEDGKVYVTGYNGEGQLSNGGATNASYPVAMKNSNGTDVTDSLLLVSGGYCYWDRLPLNTGVIRTDGTVWLSGDNTYGQIGNGTNISTNYLTAMGTYAEVRLNKRNEYIKIGETLDLDALGGTFELFNVFVEEGSTHPSENGWTWTSSNTDVATVDENGVVTGIGIGHTTITAYNEELGLKAKAIINVYRNKAGAVTVPQVASGEGFTVVLKEDGTVWATGKNDVGQLGDGSATNRNTLEQVKIDEDKYLTNIKKISIGYSHVAALTLDGQVYAWGYNDDGQLAQGDTINRSYATKVKGAEGVGYLEDIIDISCGSYETYALNKDGIAYGCGYNEYAQINDDNIKNILYPTQVTGIKNIIKLTSGECDIGAILANGETWVKGHNFFGAFGNGVAAINTGIYLVGTDINEFELSGYFAAIIKEDGTLWTTGGNKNGQLGLGDTTDRLTYTQVKYKNGKIVKTKYIALGDENLQFIGEDGKVYVTGYNGEGQLSNGGATNASYPVAMKNSNGTEVTDALLLVSGGYCYWDRLPLNTGVIRTDGTVWLSGDNTYGQIGDGTNTSTNYLTPMKWTKMPYLEKIEMQVGETRTLTQKELTCIKEYVNVFGRGSTETLLIETVQMIDTNIATYYNRTIEAKEIGNTILRLEEENGITIDVPVTVVSDDASLGLVEVNNVEIEPTIEDDHTYEVEIPKLAETAKIRVKAISKYGKVQIGESEEKQSESIVTIELDLLESRITVPVKITASDGVTEDTYNIILIRQSNEVGLDNVVVNGEELENIDNVYTYYLKDREDTVHLEITALESSNANIEVEGHKGTGYLEFDEEVKESTIKIEKKIKVTSEDGTVTKEYTLIIIRKAQIIGKITTENYLGKYISKVKLYRRRRKEEYEDEDEYDYDDDDENILITEIDTEEDGSYVLDIDEVGIYDVLVTKSGYLDYKVAQIEIKPGAIVEIEEYKLIAGDVAEDGEIEINDLVDMNRNVGRPITDDNREEKAIYDLNEDGKIDKADRNILKENYGKTAETVKWIDTNAEIAVMNLDSFGDVDEIVQTFSLENDVTTVSMNNAMNNNPDVLTSNISPLILPMTCEYRISSEYGYRIHPITGERKLHSGMDIVGEHHTEILSVADGVVVYAGTINGYGNCIEIKHVVNGETIYSFYAHLSKIEVKVGDKVSKGTVIGLQGGGSTDDNPGNSTGEHLHFELRTASGSGHSIDPRIYIEF